MLLRERLRQLFADYDPAVQKVISEVLTLEQEYISNDRPRLKDPIDEIISKVASKELGKPERPETAE
ncbi:MAG: hypothetical protein GFH27_549279n42 [Chloroflexi bacterium AL-W]|nr:hypothetical protein [Chloroflexi bacterium AL-N1]NOK71053.1 hypothetical protein [Chloroflexi bacterium AL-N10]NOK72725.1 hypothetical protein [Chloroflexi bacterium AL-N5]NOK79187.1 hypothetical protein [Chloroflexi bacterium AL-W]NOK87103.1 hypothetical protein [Chloroflexi bacterium AL-N15]